MKILLRPSLLLLGTATALLGGGGMLAYAGWPTTTDSATFTVKAARLPRIPRPTVTLPVPVASVPTPSTSTDSPSDDSPSGDSGPPVVVPRIGWRGVELAGEPVHRYVVTRHAGRVADVVCTVPATRAPSCLDLTAPPAAELTYTVAAAHGDFWVGPDSAPSVSVSTTGTPVVTGDGVPPASDVSDSPTATPTAAAPTTGASAATSLPTTPPSTQPSTPPTTAPDEIVTSPDPVITAEPTVAPLGVPDPSSAPPESAGTSGP